MASTGVVIAIMQNETLYSSSSQCDLKGCADLLAQTLTEVVNCLMSHLQNKTCIYIHRYVIIFFVKFGPKHSKFRTFSL